MPSPAGWDEEEAPEFSIQIPARVGAGGAGRPVPSPHRWNEEEAPGSRHENRAGRAGGSRHEQGPAGHGKTALSPAGAAATPSRNKEKGG